MMPPTPMTAVVPSAEPRTREELRAEIARLARERNAVILAHYYQEADIQDVAHHVGDSLQLAQAAAKTDAAVIAFAGVHFMAETAKILNPGKTVVVPDLEAGNMLAKNLTFLSRADAAGVVLGARVPIILTSRADNVRTRLASCAVAMLLRHSQIVKQPIQA